MDQPEQPQAKLMTPASLLVDIVLCGLFGAYMYSVLASHVPSHDPKNIMIWDLYTTSCMVGVFWLALQMFRVTFRAHRAASKGK